MLEIFYFIDIIFNNIDTVEDRILRIKFSPKKTFSIFIIFDPFIL